MTETLLTDDQPELISDEPEDFLGELTKPGAKFDRTKYQSEADMYKDIAKGKWYADQDIAIKNRRMDELRDNYLKEREQNIAKAKLEEYIDRMTKLSEHTPNTPQGNSEPQAFDPSQLGTMMQQEYQKIRQAETETTNYTAVQSKLKEKFGDNYANFYKKQLGDLGLTDQEAVALAKRSPQAFYRTFGLMEETRGETFQQPPRTQQRQDNFAPSAAKKRSWSYYQELKAKNPQLYFDPKIAVQMAKDAVDLGDAFKDGDYFDKGHVDNY